MEVENWQKVKAIFDSALLVETSKRNAFLEHACADYSELRGEVDGLLASSDAAGSFMETPFAGELADTLADNRANSLEPAEVFGRYTIIRKIGAGGMGEVFLAQDSELDRSVAIKILQTEAAADKDRVRRFVQEAKSASALNHPNILTVHEIGNFDESHYIATELIKGETLRVRLNRERLTLSETLDVTLQVAAALNAAHDEGIVHRDVKPENIMLRDDGLAKVLDFGLAKLTEPPAPADGPDKSEDATHVNTTPGMVMGTVNYMSPEQVRGKATDARTDVWGLAVVLYEMLTLSKPFADETANDTIAAILTKDPAPLNESVPLELQRIVKKALQKKPDERYQTVKDFLLDVKNLKRELEFSEEFERLRISAFPKSADIGVTLSGKNATEMHAAAISTQNSLARRTSNADLINEVTKRKFVSVSVLGILLAAFVGVGFFYGYSATGSASINSVAVLPFVNAGGDPEQEYLSDGISETLINKLSRLPQLKVIARNSSFQYKGKEIDPQEVAKDLRVEVIVTGSVMRRGDNVNISVEMINAADKTRIWGETYSRLAADAQNIQDEIARMILEKLSLRLTSGQQHLVKRETSSPQAFDLSLRGTFLMRRGGQANLKQAAELFEKAIAIDPNYAGAYARLSIAFSNIYGLGFGDPKEFRPKQEAAVRKAIELDPNLEDAHNALAVFLTHTFQWAEAEREYQRAVEINQNFAGAHANYARLLSSTKRHEQAIAETRRAIEIDPLRAEVYGVLPEVLVYARRYDEAIDAAKRAIEMNPREPSGYLRLADAYGHKKMYREAIAANRQAVELDDNSLATQVVLGTAFAHAGKRGKAEEILQKVLTAKEYVSQAELARFYIALGEPEKALASLEKAYTDRDGGLRFLAVDPAFDPIRTDPLFVGLLGRIGLPR